MTIEQSGIVDMIAVAPDSDVASLIVSDHWEWGNNDTQHMLRVQEKINEYLSFIEGGTLFEARPDLKGKRLVLRVIGLHQPSITGAAFYQQLREVLADAGYPFVFESPVQSK